ncbi:MAG: hypothetical protein HFG64_09535 [Lachnospiraceae bacterium]|nr:hypothetical protein [Lachnospiraceae bacterium]
MSILKQLYDGKVYPSETIIPQNRSEYRSISGKVGDDYEYFMKALSPEQVQRLEEMDHGRAKLSDMQAYANFEYGFRLGAMLMNEVFNDHREPEEFESQI